MDSPCAYRTAHFGILCPLCLPVMAHWGCLRLYETPPDEYARAHSTALSTEDVDLTAKCNRCGKHLRLLESS